MVVDHKFNYFDTVKSVVKSIITPIYKVVDFPVGIYQYLNHNNDNNKSLTKELLVLKTKEQSYNYLLLENAKLNDILNTSYTIIDNNFVLARITSIRQSRLKKHIIIDKGSNHNIQNNDIVLSSDGIIGRVINTSFDYSTVKLLTDPLHGVPVINARSGEKGIAKGIANNSNNLIIKHMNPKTDIKIGDIFVTSGKAETFNKGFIIGKVVDILQNDNNFIDIILSPSQKINKTIFVLVDIKL